MRLVYAIGLQYLWIDSLCIIQDDSRDWASETSKMGSIFHNAQLVVVAASSESTDSGLLPLSTSSRLPQGGCASTSNTEGGLQIRQRIRHLRNACTSTPIATRGWTYQERLMARRCLIFANSEVVWECLECCECECSKLGDCPTEPSLLPSWLLDTVDRAQWQRHELARKAYIFWDDAVVDFSRRAFSVLTDRLPAIATLAWP